MKSWVTSSGEGAWSTGGYQGHWLLKNGDQVSMHLNYRCFGKRILSGPSLTLGGRRTLSGLEFSLLWSTEIIIAARTDFLQKETPKQKCLEHFRVWRTPVKSLQLRNWYLEIHKGWAIKIKTGYRWLLWINLLLSHTYTHTHRCTCAHTSFSSFFSPLSIPQAQPQECTSPTLSAVDGLRSTWLVPPVLILTNSAEFQRNAR